MHRWREQVRWELVSALVPKLSDVADFEHHAFHIHHQRMRDKMAAFLRNPPPPEESLLVNSSETHTLEEDRCVLVCVARAAHGNAHAQPRTSACARIRTRTCMHTYMHTRTCTLKRAHTHTRTPGVAVHRFACSHLVCV